MGECRERIDDGIQLFHADAELVFSPARGDMRMGVCPDVRIDAQRDTGCLALGFGQSVDDFEFCDRFDIEAEDVIVKAQVDFPVGFAHSGKD